MLNWNLQAAWAKEDDFFGICKNSTDLQKKRKKVPHDWGMHPVY